MRVAPKISRVKLRSYLNRRDVPYPVFTQIRYASVVAPPESFPMVDVGDDGGRGEPTFPSLAIGHRGSRDYFGNET